MMLYFLDDFLEDELRLKTFVESTAYQFELFVRITLLHLSFLFDGLLALDLDEFNNFFERIGLKRLNRDIRLLRVGLAGERDVRRKFLTNSAANLRLFEYGVFDEFLPSNPLLGIYNQNKLQQIIGLLRNLCVVNNQTSLPHKLTFEYIRKNHRIALFFERHAPKQHVVENYSNRPNISLDRDVITFVLYF